MPAYKPGSKVAQVWEVYKTDGEERAVAFGLSIGRTPAALRAWISEWSGKAPAAIVAKPTRRQPEAAMAAASGRRRVYASYNPDRLGWVFAEGVQVSGVKWDDGTTSDTFVSNSRLVDVK